MKEIRHSSATGEMDPGDPDTFRLRPGLGWIRVRPNPVAARRLVILSAWLLATSSPNLGPEEVSQEWDQGTAFCA